MGGSKCGSKYETMGWKIRASNRRNRTYTQYRVNLLSFPIQYQTNDTKTNWYFKDIEEKDDWNPTGFSDSMGNFRDTGIVCSNNYVPNFSLKIPDVKITTLGDLIILMQASKKDIFNLKYYMTRAIKYNSN